MLLQVLFATDHLGATLTTEARLAGWAVPGGKLGLLEICTGEGIVLMTPDGRVVQQTGGPAHGGQSHQCAVCASASVCHFAAPDGASLPILAADLIAPAFASLLARAVLVPARRSVTPIRAPPVLMA